MTDVIKLLPDSVSNQIAAGEVVQRPASVVKELTENSIDAGASSVSVYIREGGRELIQVIDDGCGISPSDALRAFERHATSKISSADDLYSIKTFGFRGEALASIASVAEVELRSRKCDEEVGTRVIINGGRFVGQTAVNTPAGTQFLIKNLFYNIPARRKFLKSNSAETKHIIAEFTRVALCNPQVEMSLYNNDTCVYNLPASGLRQRIVAIAGKHTNSHLFDLSVNTSIINIEGFIGSPQFAKKTGGDQYFFVNGRYFRCPYFHKAVMQAYEKLIQSDMHPSYYLYFTVDTSRIDVNISPSKTEIKFEDEQAIWQIINAAVRESLGKLGAVPMMDFDNEDPLDIPVYTGGDSGFTEPVVSLNPDFNPFENVLSHRPSSPSPGSRPRASSFGSDVPEGWEVLYKEDYDNYDPASSEGDSFRNFIESGEEEEFISGGFGEEEYPEELQGELEIDSGGVSGISFLKVSNRYAAAMIGGKLTLIDLPRAHNRVLYEQFLSQGGDGFSVSQQELFPEPVSVSPGDITLFREYAAELADMGFEIELSDDSSPAVTLTGIPADMDDAPVAEIVASLAEGMRSDNVGDNDARRRRLAENMARSCSLTRSRAMAGEEVESLILDLLGCGEPMYTPGGKQVMTVVTENEIIKRFK